MPLTRSVLPLEVAARRRGPFPIDRTWRRDPRRFGRAGGAAIKAVDEVAATAPTFAEDLRLFAITFLAGFVFVSILLA